MNEDTIVYRQIHPNFVQDGFPTSQAFRPTPKDESKLSVYDGDQISAEQSYRHYTQEGSLVSVGVMGLQVAECTAQSIPVVPDPDPFPEHALIDFTGLNDNQCRKKGKKLQAKAVARGWLHRA
ncbi:MAG: hypothetical protein RJS97_08670 [Parvibaculaceae bacterium]